MARTLITVPPNVKKNTVIEIRVLIQHPMETGLRPDAEGKILPRNIIRQFECRFSSHDKSELVFAADLFPAISANPYLAFNFRAVRNGTLSFRWTGDNDFAQTETSALVVV